MSYTNHSIYLWSSLHQTLVITLIIYSNMMLKVLTVLFFPYRAQLAVHSVHLKFDKRMLST